MKSMLHEASTVIKAIEKAWTDSGKPREFTITVLETGERNFLGFTKRPAIVSIAYEPKKQVSRPPLGVKDSTSRAKPGFRGGSQDRRFEKPTPSRLGSPESGRQRVVVREMVQEKGLLQPVQPKQGQPQDQQRSEFDQWTSELANDIREWLKEMMQQLEADIPFTYKFDKRVLTITFDRNVLESSEDERMLFTSFSYLLVQLLKKKYKRKFRGFHLVIGAKRNATNESAQ